jgi:hypothetical protein
VSRRPREFRLNAIPPKRAKTGGSPELPRARFVPSCRSGIFNPLNSPINLLRVETFAGAACLRRCVAIHAPRQISRGGLPRAKAAPLQALGKSRATATCSVFEDDDEYEARCVRFTTLKIFSFGKAPALRYFWRTTVNTSSTPIASARPSAGLSSVYFFYFWWGSNSF